MRWCVEHTLRLQGIESGKVGIAHHLDIQMSISDLRMMASQKVTMTGMVIFLPRPHVARTGILCVAVCVGLWQITWLRHSPKNFSGHGLSARCRRCT